MPTTDDDSRDEEQRRLDPIDEAEVTVIAETLAAKVVQGTMPPDDAYAWTRYVCAALRRREEER